MEAYKPPFHITANMLDSVANISEKLGQISVYRELEAKPHLRRNNRIKSIHASLKIEANSMSLSDVRDVINGRTVIGDRMEIQEVKNAYEAYEMIPELQAYSISDLLRAHGVLTKGILKESGVFRSGQEGVFSNGVPIFIAPPPEMVPSQVKDLMDWVQGENNTIHPLILSSVFHYEFVFIHPFADGNGRMARLWQTVILSHWKPVFEYIPIESQIEHYQEEYYNAISACHKNGNSDVFVEFMLKMIDQVLGDVLAQNAKVNAETSEYVKRMLDCMEYDVPYTSKAIMEALGLRSKETLRKNYIDPAIALGLIEMTLPDKPRSKNQRYVKR